jgi:hypothetical protein
LSCRHTTHQHCPQARCKHEILTRNAPEGASEWSKPGEQRIHGGGLLLHPESLIRPRTVDRSPASLVIKRARRNDLGDGGCEEGMAGPGRGNQRPDGHGWTWTHEVFRGADRHGRSGPRGPGPGPHFWKFSVSLCSPATEEVEMRLQLP